MGLGLTIRVCMATEKEIPAEWERSATAVLLSLPGFVLLAVSAYEGELEQAVKTTADLVGVRAAVRSLSCMTGGRCGFGISRVRGGRSS